MYVNCFPIRAYPKYNVIEKPDEMKTLQFSIRTINYRRYSISGISKFLQTKLVYIYSHILKVRSESRTPHLDQQLLDNVENKPSINPTLAITYRHLIS